MNPLILHSDATGEGTPLPLGLTGLPTLIEQKPVHYRRKEIIADGDWTHRGIGTRFNINPARTELWEKNFRRRLAAGIRTPILKRHTEAPTADDTLGYVVGIERQGEKVFADMQFIGDDALALAARNDVSIYEKSEGRDAKGNVFETFLDHIALTPNPNQPNLGPFMTIALDASGASAEVPVYRHQTSGAEPERSPIMKPETITKLRAKLNLTDATKVSDEEIAERAATLALADVPADRTAEVTALSADVTRLTGELATAKATVLSLSADAPKQPDPWNMSLLAETFKSKREAAIATGNISEAGANLIDALLMPQGGTPGVGLALSGDGATARPLYSRIFDIIAANPGVKADNAVTRAKPSLQLSGDADQLSADELKAKVEENLQRTQLGRSALAAKKTA